MQPQARAAGESPWPRAKRSEALGWKSLIVEEPAPFARIIHKLLLKGSTQRRRDAMTQSRRGRVYVPKLFSMNLVSVVSVGTYTRPHPLGAVAPLRLCVRPFTGNSCIIRGSKRATEEVCCRPPETPGLLRRLKVLRPFIDALTWRGYPDRNREDF